MSYSTGGSNGNVGLYEDLSIARQAVFQEGRSFSISGISGWRTVDGTGDTIINDIVQGAGTPQGYSIYSSLQSTGDLKFSSAASATASGYGSSQGTTVLGAGSISSSALSGSNSVSQLYQSKDGSLTSQQSLGAASGRIALSGSTSIDGPGQINTDAKGDSCGTSHRAITDGNGGEHLSGDTFVAAFEEPKIAFSSLAATGDKVSFTSEDCDLQGTYSTQNMQSDVTSPLILSQISYVTDSGTDDKWDYTGKGVLEPVKQSWTSNDENKTKKVINELSCSGDRYSIKGSVVTGNMSVSISQHLSISEMNGKLNTKQVAYSNNTNGENLSAYNILTSTGSVEGDQWAGADALKADVSQKLRLTGNATDSTGSAIGDDKSLASTSIEKGVGINLNVASQAWSNMVDSTVYNKTSANLAVTGKASEADAKSSSYYNSVGEANAHGNWNNKTGYPGDGYGEPSDAYGDLSVKAETVKSATASVELNTTSDNAYCDTTSKTEVKGTTSDNKVSGIKVESKGVAKGDVSKFEAHLYSHSYPKNENHEIDESVSTASLGVDGNRATTTLYRWSGSSRNEWTKDADRMATSGEPVVLRVNDIDTTARKRNSELKIWDVPKRTAASTPSTTVPWGVDVMYSGQYKKDPNAGRWIDVAVVDTGIDARHPDLVMRLEDYAATSDYYPGEADKSDSNGHGTFISGIIAADGGFDGKGIWGMAPGANLRVYAFSNINAIYRATDLGAEIVSMSWGNYEDGFDVAERTRQTNAVKYALNYGVLPVAAAGNGVTSTDYKDPAIILPASIEGVVAVGAVDNKSNSIYWSSPGYNEGSGTIGANMTMFAAPGVYVYSTSPTYKVKDYTSNYDHSDGTSFATPYISGLAAKLWSDNIFSGQNATYITDLMKSYTKNNNVTKVYIEADPDGSNKKEFEKAKNNTYIKKYTPPWNYYDQILAKWGDGKEGQTVELDVLKGDDNPLAGLGIPKIPKS